MFLSKKLNNQKHFLFLHINIYNSGINLSMWLAFACSSVAEHSLLLGHLLYPTGSAPTAPHYPWALSMQNPNLSTMLIAEW